MKKSMLFMAFSLLVCAANSTAQSSINKLSRQAQSSISGAQNNSTKAVLSNLDTELMKKFSLDGVKSEIVGNTLKMKVADTDLAKLSASARDAKGNDMLNSAMDLLKGNGMNLKGLGVTNVLLEMVKNMSLKEILGSVSKKL
ncbi:MAG: hypothetical protein FGM41_06730 [Bacteroidetes bacterium]|nr:hypothetical protein [Bacteroidota bacterium]